MCPVTVPQNQAHPPREGFNVFCRKQPGTLLQATTLLLSPLNPLISRLASSLSAGGRRVSFPRGRARAETEAEEQILILYKYLLGSETLGSRERTEYE